MLKQLRLKKKLELLRAEMTVLEEKDVAFSERTAKLESAMEEAATEDDIQLIDKDAETLEGEVSENDAAKGKLAEKIAELEGELQEMEDNARAAIEEPAKGKERSKEPMGRYAGITSAERKYMKRPELRQDAAEMLKREEVRDFFTAMRDHVSQKRALNNAELTIPLVLIDRIQENLGDYGVLYNEVQVERVNGDAQVIMDGADPEAIWTEMCDPVQELATGFVAVELFGFKVGGFIPVCNAILEDSMIDLYLYVMRKLTKSIAKALDKAILTGALLTDASRKQPAGIIPNLADDNKITLDAAAVGGIFGSLLASVGLIDDGEDAPGEIIAVMKRSTYYKEVAPRQILENSSGTYTVPNVSMPNVAGLRVVFSQYMPVGQTLIGDFKRYLLGERAGVKLGVSTDVRFIEDQTVFKGTARYDGKPVHIDEDNKTGDWVLATFPANP